MIADTAALMAKYLDGKEDLSNDEREILLFALYIESRARGGLAVSAERQKPVPAGFTNHFWLLASFLREAIEECKNHNIGENQLERWESALPKSPDPIAR